LPGVAVWVGSKVCGLLRAKLSEIWYQGIEW
jgi:hypothetical protein